MQNTTMYLISVETRSSEIIMEIHHNNKTKKKKIDEYIKHLKEHFSFELAIQLLKKCDHLVTGIRNNSNCGIILMSLKQYQNIYKWHQI